MVISTIQTDRSQYLSLVLPEIYFLTSLIFITMILTN